MQVLLVLPVILAVMVGVSLGLLGGGGSILMVPLLAYVAGLDPKDAIAGSLFAVGVTSVSGAIAHARAGNVRWRVGVVFGLAGMAGAFCGGLAGGHLPGTMLMIVFAVVILAAAIAMIRGRGTTGPASLEVAKLPVLHVILQGLAVGAVAGLVGAGGGFLIVPALALLGGVAMPVAVGTSLLVMWMQTFAGLAGYLTVVTMDWPLMSAVAIAAIMGSILGARVNARIPEKALRRGFGVFVVAMGVFILAQELPSSANIAVIATIIVIVAIVASVRIIRLRARIPSD